MNPHGAAVDGRLPDFIIIGAMKAATTSLGAYLDAHPDLACIGETHYFCCNHDRGPDWYRAQFSAANGRVVGEKTPHYLADRTAVDRMAELVPNARLIAILRDPVDRALSHYWHNRRLGREPRDVNDALLPGRSRPEDDGGPSEGSGYLERGRYLEQLRHVTSRFERSALKIFLFEDVRDRPGPAFADACRFLGVDPGPLPDVLGDRANPYREHRPEWLWRLMFRRRLWRFLPARAASRIGRWLTRETEYPPVEPSLRATLGRVFADDNRALSEWLGRDLSAWGA